MKTSNDPKIKTKWKKQSNSNKYMGSGYIQSRNSTVKESELKNVDRKSKENNNNV